MAWLVLGILLALFVGLHVLPFAVSTRAGLARAMGEPGYRAAYGMLSVFGLFGAFFVASGIQVPTPWAPPVALRWLALALTALGFVLIASAYLGGKGWRLARHPMLAGFALWAFAHLLTVRSLALALTFAVLGVYAVLAMVASDRRDARQDPAAFALRRDQTALVPLLGLARGRGTEGLRMRALVVGLALWAVLLAGHAWLFGVSPLPFAR